VRHAAKFCDGSLASLLDLNSTALGSFPPATKKAGRFPVRL
jgi:hypothetical protein